MEDLEKRLRQHKSDPEFHKLRNLLKKMKGEEGESDEEMSPSWSDDDEIVQPDAEEIIEGEEEWSNYK